jgi:hypothetical protein
MRGYLGAVVPALYLLDGAKEHTLYEQAGTHLVDLHAEIIKQEMKAVESDWPYQALAALLRAAGQPHERPASP